MNGHKLNFFNNINRQKLGIHLTDLVISSVVALFIVLVITSTIGANPILEGLMHESSTKWLSAVSKPDFSAITAAFSEINYKLFIASSFLIIVIAVVLSYCLIHNRIANLENNRVKVKAQKYQQYFSQLITEESPQYFYLGGDKKKNKEHLSKEDFTNINNREVLLNELRSMHSMVSGNEKQKLHDLYFTLGFVDELEEKYFDVDWISRASAIDETIQFKVDKLYPLLFRLTKDANRTVREKAILARVKLDDNPLDVLHEINRPLSIWEKHSIIQTLNNLPSQRIPNFRQLALKLDIHRKFLIDLADQFYQAPLEPKLRRMA